MSKTWAEHQSSAAHIAAGKADVSEPASFAKAHAAETADLAGRDRVVEGRLP